MNDPSNPHPRPTDRLAAPSLAAVVGWGLGLRVVAADLVQWYTERRGLLCVFPDTAIYWGLAGAIRRGEPFEVVYFGDLPHFALRTPGYPLFLAACQVVFGPRLLPVRLAQAALGAGCVWLVARLVRRALPGSVDPPGAAWTAALIAALFAALDPYVVANSALVLSEAVFLPLMLLAQWGLAVLWAPPGERPSLSNRRAAGWALLTGAASGAAVLVRPSWALYVPAVLAAWVGLSGRCRRAAAWRAALVAVGLVVVMAPWWVRNARVYGRFVPTALWTGASLYDGLNPRATGASDMEFLSDPEFWPLDEEAQDAALRDRALAFAREHPGRVLWLAAVKAARFWSPWPNAEGFRSTPLAVASALITLPQFALLALGAWDRRRDPRALVLLGLPLLYVFALHLVFVSSMRYRVPVAVPALGLAAAGLRRVVGKGERDG
jgi:4-amino-4-deoxy-L-arabinose transferase-like glycosyltransferase